jgi:hypothetical protein
MTEATAIPVRPSSARRRYLTLDVDGGWILTTPAPPADYRLFRTWPRGDRQRLDLEVTDDGNGWRLTIVGWSATDTVVGRGCDALREALRFFLPFVPCRKVICECAA